MSHHHWHGGPRQSLAAGATWCRPRSCVGERRRVCGSRINCLTNDDPERADALVASVRMIVEQVRPMLKRESFLRPEAVREIAESMLEIGQETPILVRPDGDRFVLVDGLHRLEACKALGEDTIVGFLVSGPSTKAPSPYDAEADAIREKTERLRTLRLAKEAEEKRRATSDVVPMEATKSSTDKSSGSGHIATRAKPATLADWLVGRERDGFRH
jgi:uncharacterized ParB-like nuclease family protein